MKKSGVGADQFDAEDFDVDFAPMSMVVLLESCNTETFSAAGAEITLKDAMSTWVQPRSNDQRSSIGR